MALFTKTQREAGVAQAPTTGGLPAPEVGGLSAAECMQVGQILVEGEQLTPEALATTLQLANGDLLLFSDLAIGRFGAGRYELEQAIAKVFDLPTVDTKQIVLDPEIAAKLDEAVIRAHQVIPVAEEGDTLIVLAADPSPHRRAAVEAAAKRPIRWFVSDFATVRTFIDSSHRADADIDRLVKSFEVTEDQRAGVA